MAESALLNNTSLYTGEKLGDKIWSRAQNLNHQRFVFNTVYQEIAELVSPIKANILLIRWPGTLTNQKIFDCTAIQAAQRLGSALQSTLTNDSIRWFDLVVTNEDLMKRENVRRWLADTSTRMFDAMSQSNMGMQMNELYGDIVKFGSALCLMEEQPLRKRGFNGLIFQTYHVSEYVWDVDPFGIVNEVYRQFKINAMDAKERWGYDALSKNMRDAYDKGMIDQMFPVIHGVYPREDASYFGNKVRMPWASVYVAKDERHVIYEGGYKRFPYLAPRWSKASDEVYGRSPSMDALADIRTLNRIVELELRSMVKAVNPPIITNDDGALGGTLTIKPGGVAYIRQGSELRYLESAANFAAVNLKKAELQDSVRKAYFIDQLMLPPAQGTPMTATEINRRMEQMWSILGPEMSRLVSELLRPLVRNTFEIMWNAGALQGPPTEIVREVEKVGKPIINVAFKGPLARAQKMSDVVAAERWVNEIVGPMAQADPGILDIVDTDSLARIGADRLGVPWEIVRKAEDVLKMRQDRAKAQQQQMAMQQRNEALAALGKAAPAVQAVQEAE